MWLVLVSVLDLALALDIALALALVLVIVLVVVLVLALVLVLTRSYKDEVPVSSDSTRRLTNRYQYQLGHHETLNQLSTHCRPSLSTSTIKHDER